jgi:dipeptidyl aminopeptidase/acylaminoacyl peptidase
VVAADSAEAELRAVGSSLETDFGVAHDALEIQCILSYPDQPEGRFPAMLLISGSGLHDADVTVDEPTLAITEGPQTLFRPLARQFSRSGWAVMRCNKRGASFGHRADEPHLLAEASLDDLVEDARNALHRLHAHPRARANPLVVFGHSEGAVVASRLALDTPEIDLLVLAGSVARSAGELLEFQLVDRNLRFLRLAADADRDGVLTLAEMSALDGRFGLGSVYVFNSAAVLYRQTHSPESGRMVLGFNSATDLDGDGRLQIDTEIEPALRRESERFLALVTSGDLGRYWQSSLEAEAPVSYIHRIEVPILFVHGELDAQAPLDEPLALIAELQSRGRTSYDLMVIPQAGHSLSAPNDFFHGDDGLSILDNLTLNAPPTAVRRRLLKRIEAILAR